MSEHHATVQWSRQGRDFEYQTYSRTHVVGFDGEIFYPGRAAPDNIPETAPGGPGVDPEQAFVASLSACHMLRFLHLACQGSWIVDRYSDEAVGVLEQRWMSRVTLRPVVSFSGRAPSEEEHRRLHERAHEKCYIANSVKSEVVVQPRIA